MSPGLRHFWVMLGLHGLCNTGAALLGILYAVLAVIPTLPAYARTQSLWWAAIALSASYAILVPVIYRVVRPTVRALSRGEAATDEERRAGAVAALHAPWRQSVLALAIWLLAAASLPLTFWRPPGGYTQEMPHSLLALVLIGFVAFTCTFYALEAHVRRAVLPRLLGSEDATALGAGATPSLRLRIPLLVATTCLVPVSALTLSSLYGTLTPTLVVYLGASFLFLGGLQGVFISRSIHLPLQALGRQMERVQREDLDAHVPVLSTDVLGRLGAGFNQMVAGLRRGRSVKETFGRYVAPAVVEEILAGKVALGGEERLVTVLFTDLRGFTSFSEELKPAQVVAFLNQFLDRMVEVLIRHGATIDKFIGDSVMATFGVPVSRSPEEDARAAVRAAVEMVAAVEAWNKERAEKGEKEVALGIGIHSGEVVAGNIGSSRKMEYTVIGDTVNTASRIESLTKTLGAQVLISEATFHLTGDLALAEPFPDVEVKGKRHPLRVFAVRGLAARGARGAA